MSKYGRRFWHKRVDLKYDRFTYGDWRQYLAIFDDGLTKCVRRSSLPFYIGFLAFAMLALMITALGAIPSDRVLWGRWAACSIVSFLVLLYLLIQYARGYVLVVPVGPMNKLDYRVYPGEEKADA